MCYKTPLEICFNLTGLCIIVLSLPLTIRSYQVKLQPRPPGEIISLALYPKAFFKLFGRGKILAQNFRAITSSQRAAASHWPLLCIQLRMTELCWWNTGLISKVNSWKWEVAGKVSCRTGTDVLSCWHTLPPGAELSVLLPFKKKMCVKSVL